jgi:single-strand DNA-binding protein
MSKGVNTVTLLGNVGRDVETRSTQTGLLVANISLATNERQKSGNEWKDHTEWHAVTAFGRTAEIARDYLHKGSQVFVTGKLRTTSWEDDKQVKRYRTNIIVDDLVLLDGASNRPPEPPTEAYEGQF